MQKKRIMISALALVVVALVASWGVNAYFNDVENNGGNKVTAGIMDLTTADNATAYVTVDPVYPGYSSATPVEFTLVNVGNINGLLTITMDSFVTSSGVPDNEPELAATGNSASGDLQEVLSVTITATGATTYTGLLSGFTGFSDLAMGSGDTITVTMSFTVPTTADNQIQGDTVTFSLLFVLEQDEGNEI